MQSVGAAAVQGRRQLLAARQPRRLALDGPEGLDPAQGQIEGAVAGLGHLQTQGDDFSGFGGHRGCLGGSGKPGDIALRLMGGHQRLDPGDFGKGGVDGGFEPRLLGAEGDDLHHRPQQQAALPQLLRGGGRAQQIDRQQGQQNDQGQGAGQGHCSLREGRGGGRSRPQADSSSTISPIRSYSEESVMRSSTMSPTWAWPAVM